MTRTPLRERMLPGYKRGEDIANMITHIVGGAIGIAVLVFAIIIPALHRNVYGVVGGSIYGASMIALYSVSSVYHGLNPCYAKKVMQVIDHCTIYFLIVGTYTPILLSSIRPMYPKLAWTVFGIEWGLSLIGGTFTAIDHNKYKHFSMLCYLGMGWCIVFAARPTILCMGWTGFGWLILGGMFYTVGAILYGIGKKKPVYHTVFHVFVDLGSIFQAVAVLFYVL